VTHGEPQPVCCPLEIAADHPAYAGHFPGMPILPGAALLDEALHLIAASRSLDLRVWRLTSAKFLLPVRPGDRLTLEHAAPSASSIRFLVRNAHCLVASGMLSHGA